jgi:hypothetical protein
MYVLTWKTPTSIVALIISTIISSLRKSSAMQPCSRPEQLCLLPYVPLFLINEAFFYMIEVKLWSQPVPDPEKRCNIQNQLTISPFIYA